MYRYREVKCPYCEKKYMWEVTGESEYFIDSSGKRVASQSVCPKCTEVLAVFDGVLEGVPLIDLSPDIKAVREIFL